MKVKFLLCILIVITAFSTIASADSNTRSVQSEFDRCTAVIERFERSLRRFEDAVNVLKRDPTQLPVTGKDLITREIASLENRYEYFCNRFERVRGQADKIRGDLKNLSGPICPSCVLTSVNLYCRTGETIQNDIDEYLLKAAELKNRIGIQQKLPIQTENISKGTVSFTRRRTSADSLCTIAQSCNNPAAATLYRQGVLNLQRADSLYKNNKETPAFTVLNIAVSLLQKALHRCNNK